MSGYAAEAVQLPDLGMVAYEYMFEESQKSFIGSRIFPIFETSEVSAKYPIIPIEAILKTKDTKRSSSGKYNRDNYEWDQGTFSCEENGWEERVEDSERRINSRFFDQDEVAVLRAVDIILRNHEIRVANAVMNETNVPQTTTVSNAWDVAASATPYDDVIESKRSLRAATGIKPNKMAVSYDTFLNILRTEELKDAFKYTNPTEIMDEVLKKGLLTSYFGVEEFLVGDAQKDVALKKKSGGYTLNNVWSDSYALLSASYDTMDLKKPQLGRTFLYIEDSPEVLVTEGYREEATRSDILRVRHYTDEAFVFSGAGALIKGIKTP